MSKIIKTPTGQTFKIIPIKFRWPIKQTNDKQINIEIKTGEPLSLYMINEEASKIFKLSEEEYNRALDATESAIIESIMIIK